MLRIAICDDSLTDRVVMEGLVKQYCTNNGVEVSIQGYHNAEMLIDAADSDEFDLIFMDIFLGGMQGNEAARILLKKETACVIFITSSVEFALEGFEIGVFHYVVKPFSYEKIAKTMDKYIKTYYTASLATINVKPVGNEPDVAVKLNDICYIESFDKIRCIHLKNSDIRTYMTMNELIQMLNENSFCRPHRSYIVNLYHVEKMVKNELLLDTGVNIPVSRSLYDGIVEKYKKYNS